MIGSRHTYFTRDRALSCGCPISGIRFELLVIPSIGYPRDFHVNHKRLNGFRQCFLQFSKLRKSASDVFAQKKFSKDILNSRMFSFSGIKKRSFIDIILTPLEVVFA